MSNKTILGNLPHLRARLGGHGVAQRRGDDEPPFRSELLSARQMEQHGKALAGSHKLRLGHAPEQLLARLAENESVLLKTRDLLTDAVKSDRRITPAGEWLLDNFYLIEEQVRMAKRSGRPGEPQQFFNGLPDGHQPETGRIVGNPHHAAPGID